MHSATLEGNTFVCSCGERFPAFRKNAEPDFFESPGWEAHAKETR